MGRLIRLLPLALMLILLFGVPARAENWLKVQPEQVRIILPEIKLWLYEYSVEFEPPNPTQRATHSVVESHLTI